MADQGVRRTLHTVAVDRYLETIYCIETEGEPVRPGRIAQWLGVTAPTVSIGLRRLLAGAWIATELDRSVRLTPSGRAVAEGIVRRHRLVERWLTDSLEMDWASAHTEARRLAPALSEEVLSRLDTALGRPTTCPHGDPIPGRSAPYGALITLADLARGTPAAVRRISEIMEHEAFQVLRDLGAAGVHTGVQVTVVSGGGTVTLSIGGDRRHPIRLPDTAARLIWVETAEQER
jgi:DtxR family transcriptional regulator, Mn-dependent transcriptional regulator